MTITNGINIIRRALEEPLRQIAFNAGLEGSVIVEQPKKEEVGIGFNAATGEWVDMIKAGIVDPAKVTRSALQNAASVAAMVLTTEAVVADKPERREEQQSRHGRRHGHDVIPPEGKIGTSTPTPPANLRGGFFYSGLK